MKNLSSILAASFLLKEVWCPQPVVAATLVGINVEDIGRKSVKVTESDQNALPDQLQRNGVTTIRTGMLNEGMLDPKFARFIVGAFKHGIGTCRLVSLMTASVQQLSRVSGEHADHRGRQSLASFAVTTRVHAVHAQTVRRALRGPTVGRSVAGAVFVQYLTHETSTALGPLGTAVRDARAAAIQSSPAAPARSAA